MLADHFRQQEGGYRGAEKGDERQRQRMRQCRVVAVLPLREGCEEFSNAFAEINRQAEDGAQLDEDRKHLPISVAEVDVQQRFADAQMRRRTDGQEFGKTFDNAKQGSKQVRIQSSSRKTRETGFSGKRKNAPHSSTSNGMSSG